MRRQGILMPISAIPSKYGIGTLGEESYRFVDFLREAGQTLWQILPLGPTGYGDSPYQSFSTFAGNPYFIDPELLIREGYLTREECDACDFGGDAHSIDYEKMYFARFELLAKAFSRGFKEVKKKREYLAFVEKNAYWLDDYALYMAIKNSDGEGRSFIEWDADIRLRRKSAMEKCRKTHKADIDFYKFQQYLFFTQWKALKDYANERGIEIVGDIPIYVAFDSADTWADPKLFRMDEKGYPIEVAGCPPDYFSETGQLWGNPIYDWEYHKKTGYEWWMRRFAHCFELYDVVRIDHFRGFDEYWAIPYGDATAVGGRWVKGPGYELFATLKKTLGKKKVIAEDLGFMTDSVRKLVRKTGFPNMKILQFAFESNGESEYLPYRYDRNCVVYTGTHDNDTTVGFVMKMSEKDIRFAQKYLHCKKRKNLCREMIRAGMASVADTVIIPMQDWLELDNSARINIPSTLGDNWKWRMDPKVLTRKLARKIYKMTRLYGRI
ncbi:MAG: 4-alpha-glucanotransferase [Clostridium sp.]|nr:4-alpha-glucanotransferase [Acetatifactor muris]MCM1527944.1 4-alpha-glucanotransferase [Bacteroides sp.]MCM1564138.1 4-alpha-glucanotransferase [Clostridium sp.]